MQDLLLNVKDLENFPVPWPMNDEERICTYDMRVRSGDPELVGDFLVPYKGWAKKYAALMTEQHNAPPAVTHVFPKLPPGYPSGPLFRVIKRVDQHGTIVFEEEIDILRGEDNDSSNFSTDN